MGQNQELAEKHMGIYVRSSGLDWLHRSLLIQKYVQDWDHEVVLLRGARGRDAVCSDVVLLPKQGIPLASLYDCNHSLDLPL